MNELTDIQLAQLNQVIATNSRNLLRADELETRNRNLLLIIRELRDRIAMFQSRETYLFQRNDELTKLNRELNSEVDNLKALIARLSLKDAPATTEPGPDDREILLAQIKDLTAKITDLKAAKDQLSIQVDSLSMTNKDLERSNAAVIQTNNAQMFNLANATAVTDSLRAKIEAARQALA
jgi:seryl-tRNA synthetase